MSSRLDGVISDADPLRQLDAVIARIERNFAEIKAAQRTSGASGVLAYPTETGAEWDLQGTVGQPGAFEVTQVVVRMTFTAAHAQAYPIAIGTFDGYWELEAGHNIVNYGINVDKAYYRDPAVRVWNWIFEGTGRYSYYLKGRVAASVPGSLVVEAL